MNEPMFYPRRVAGMMKQHLLSELKKLQERMLLVERFGPDAVTEVCLFIGKKGADRPLPEMLAKHAEFVAQIDALQAALDKASEADLAAFVAGVKARHNL